MKPIHFRGQNYDPAMLSKSGGQGYKAKIPTKDIMTVAASKAFEVKIAVMIENKYHLLTGTIDPKLEVQDLIVISKIVLKKALLQNTTFAERQFDDRRETQQRARQGFGSYRY